MKGGLYFVARGAEELAASPCETGYRDRRHGLVQTDAGMANVVPKSRSKMTPFTHQKSKPSFFFAAPAVELQYGYTFDT